MKLNNVWFVCGLICLIFLIYNVNAVITFEKTHDQSKQRIKNDVTGERITKRSADTSCGEIANINNTLKAGTNKHIFLKDGNPAISLTWSGTNGVMLALTTMNGFTLAPSKLYRSDNRGKVFQDISSQIEGANIRKLHGIQVSPVDTERVVFVGYDSPFSKSHQTDLYITTDAGRTFKKVTCQFLIDAETLVFNPKDRDSLLVKSTDSVLWVSTDFGQVWRKVSDSVFSAKWDPKAIDHFYYVIDPLKKMSKNGVDNELYRQSVSESSGTILAQHVHSFAVQENFLFLSVQFPGNNGSRVMHVSTDHGSSWAAAQLPLINPEQFYSILDMSEQMVFVHVDHPGDTGHGVIYTSDERGIVFSKSLSRHLYPNTQGITDFYKVSSMPGVYITSQLSKENTVHSQISFNKGGDWESINRPAHTTCPPTEKECKLQIHNFFSASKHVSLPSLPLSSKSALGIILAHGNLGDGLNFNPPNVYVSNDGGYSWKQPDGLKGPHFYGIGDSGGILFAVPSSRNPINTIRFSLDEGDCWHAYNFTDQPIQVTGISAEPGEKSTDISIWGWDRNGDGSWMAITVDFKDIMGTFCENSDYEVWKAHETNVITDDGCMLGQKYKYVRRKKGTACINKDHLTNQPSVEPCSCQRTDYLCDYGYIRTADYNCVWDTSLEKAHMDICINNEEETIETKGYRKIPGDGCVKGFNPDRTTKIVSKSCAKVQKIDEEFGVDKGGFETYTPTPHNSPHTGLIVFLVLAVLALGGALSFVIYTKRKSMLKVRYTPLPQEGDVERSNGGPVSALVGTSSLVDDDDDAVIVDPDRDLRPNKGATISYHDDSDEDLLVT